MKSPIQYYNLFGDYAAKHLPRFKRALIEIQELGADQQYYDAYQLLYLRRLVQRGFTHSNYFREKCDTLAISVKDITRDDLIRLPTLTRLDLRDHLERLVFNDIDFNETLVTHTSGTTGPRLRIIQTLDDMLYKQVLSAYILEAFGVSIANFTADRAGIIRVSAFAQSQSIAFTHALLNGSVYQKINISQENWSSEQQIIAYLTQENPVVLSGIPEHLMTLAGYYARYRSSTQQLTALKLLISGGNSISPAQQLRLEEVFTVPVVDVYVSTELGSVAFRNASTNQYVISPHHLVEQSLATGELIITYLHSTTLPFIRYMTGDWGQVSGSGRHLTAFGGRINQSIKLTDRELHPYPLLKALDKIDLDDYQVVQQSKTLFLVKFVANPAKEYIAKDRILAAFKAVLGHEIEIVCVCYDQLPYSTCKSQRFTSEI